MKPSQKRTLLNTGAAFCGAVAGVLVTMGHPVIGLAFASASTFLAGWANLSKPGDLPAMQEPPPQ